jgi:translation initiation factor 5
MSNKINIQGLNDISDPFYRYTMTKLNVIRQKNKTIIDNLETICQDLERDSLLLVSYFKKKFNSSFNYKDNVLSTTRTNITYQDFEKVLREFIENFVLCEKCKLPETILQQNSNEILLNCKCCSYVTKHR